MKPAGRQTQLMAAGGARYIAQKLVASSMFEKLS